MGGNDGNRGYLLQAIIAVLTVLENDSCTRIAIEPNDEHDKVDIKWEDGEQRVTVCQVKSSINQFSKAQILDHLTDLVQGTAGAQVYNLTLIGGSSAETRKYFNSMRDIPGKDFKAKHQALIPLLELLFIEYRTLDIKTQEGYVQNLLYRFLVARGYRAEPNTLELIAKAITYQFGHFATEGKMVEKADFEKLILDWLHFNYRKQISSDVQLLDLIFYNGGSPVPEKEISTSFRLPNLSSWSYYKEKIAELSDLYDRISGMELPGRSEPVQDKSPFDSHLSRLLSKENPVPSGCTDSQIEEISKLCRKYLTQNPEPEFFQVGNLMETNQGSILWSIHRGPTYVGTEDEKNKQDLLDKLSMGLSALKDLSKFWNKINAYRIIPLAVVNAGNSLNESIDIQLSIPEGIEFLRPDNFPIPKFKSTLEKLTEEGGLIESGFAHHTDVSVKGYQRRFHRPVDLKIPNILGSRKKDLEELATALLHYVFDFHNISSPAEKQVIGCHITALKPGEKMALPAYLFVKADAPFTVDYQIRSNQCSGIIGKLEVL